MTSSVPKNSSTRQKGSRRTDTMITRGPPLPSTPIGRSTPLHVVLAQLSFSTDVPQEDVQRNPGSVWSGLLCTSFEDDDLFFDAEQDRVGIASSMSSLLETRGGSYDAMNESESQAGKANVATKGASGMVHKTRQMWHWHSLLH